LISNADTFTKVGLTEAKLDQLQWANALRASRCDRDDPDSSPVWSVE
jgi:hypothetical protein